MYLHHQRLQIVFASSGTAVCICIIRHRGATLKVGGGGGGLTSDLEWRRLGGGGGGAKTLFLVTLYNFQKSGGGGLGDTPSPSPSPSADPDHFLLYTCIMCISFLLFSRFFSLFRISFLLFIDRINFY